MRLLRLEASNFKRLRAVDITPEGHMVPIVGRNAAGKSSVLDGIEAIFASAAALPKRPVRAGADRAVLRASVGEGEAVEYILTRRITAAGGTSLVIEAPSGARYPRPQEFVDRLIGAISFDPMEFARAKPKMQFEALRQIVKLDVDADALDGQNRRDFEARTDINREAARLRGQASGIAVPAGLPGQPIDTAALFADIQRAGDHNRGIDREAESRRRSEDLIATDLHTAEVIEREIAKLQEEAAEKRQRAKEQRRALDAMPALSEPTDTAALAESLRQAQATNSQIAEAARRATLEAEAAALEKRSAALTDEIAARTQAKAEALARAQFPVPGLAFGDGEILYRDIPFEQASQAEKIQVSVAVAIAANPKLRVLCVRDGSLLDADSLKLLSELVTASDYQCWVEVTDDDGQVGIIIEDGVVKGAPEIVPETSGAKIIAGLEDAVRHAGGDESAARVTDYVVTPTAPEGKTVRRARPKPATGDLLGGA